MELKDNKFFLIDLDGVILDTKYDNYFWQIHIPNIYAELNKMSLEDAINITHTLFHYKKKTREWYDIIYWSNILGIDIAKEKLKKENMDRIKLIKGSIKTLNDIKKSGRKLFLITNAHRTTLNIKLKKFNISKYFDDIVCSHELGYVKEDIQLWHILRTKLQLDYKYTVLIEDTFDNINSAYHAGISNFVHISDKNVSNSRISALTLGSFSELSSSI
ncbi:MAG: HAD-IA family hydrolase [Gammaproteobacteria bacterium]|jgi:5'-nucleotidase|nr:HAD-IA family hydrolase [Gammaproteobacteria bacterium]MBT4462295.1 HAD-IA family hydrolase [Gammaproteobacteria bacterium]MBT4655222.1 HAD-IA family hydrolase [Gammaproteobacteria bacterium]MBT5117005.1 HAD-IA family hydrolase [Gammaproteobacteria bacterium]MBT5762038.1 HAD-IA family hydrolase [Gammaproteobacteria bacterium]